MQDRDGFAIIGVGGNASSIPPVDRIALTDLGAVYSETGTHGSAEGGSIVRCTPYSTKKFDRYRTITYPQYGNGLVIRGNDLIVSKIGRVKVVWHRPVEGEIKTVSLKRSRTNKWYVTFSVEKEPERLPASPRGRRRYGTLLVLDDLER
jgi:hypothetical protein